MTALPNDYLAHFGGIGRLFGASASECLFSAHVAVVGVGGVGSWAVEGLARSGVGAITLVDPDVVCVSNFNRQLPATVGTVGRPKVFVLEERIHSINPSCRTAVHVEAFDAASEDRLLSPGFDAVIDAIDSVPHKALLIASCVKRSLLCVTVSGAGGKRDSSLVRTGDLGESTGDELLRLVRKKLRREHGFAGGEGNLYGVRCVFSSEKQVYPWSDGSCRDEPEPGVSDQCRGSSRFGTASFVTAPIGFAAAGEAVKAILNRRR